MAKKHDANKVPPAKATCGKCSKLKLLSDFDWSSPYQVVRVDGTVSTICKKCERNT